MFVGDCHREAFSALPFVCACGTVHAAKNGGRKKTGVKRALHLLLKDRVWWATQWWTNRVVGEEQAVAVIFRVNKQVDGARGYLVPVHGKHTRARVSTM